MTGTNYFNSACHYLFKGLHYRSRLFYNTCDFLKLGTNRNLRYKIAARYINSKQSVVDVCAGTGTLKKFLLKDCSYEAIEASTEFLKVLELKGIKCQCLNLHQELSPGKYWGDVIVMIISLSQFRKTSVDKLLEYFKGAAGRVVIIEEVLSSPRLEKSFYQGMVNHLCANEYYIPVVWYTSGEFEEVMKAHGYRCERVTERYRVGIYDKKDS